MVLAVHFTSDTHFGDPRVLRIDRRPFADLAAHDAALIEAWNAVVGAGDEVWHLGDFALGPKPARIRELLAALAGTKHLIIGNNDGPETLAAPGWASVGHYAEIEVAERRLVLCHYAFRTWNRMGRGVLNLHGHSHGKLSPMPRQYDVGVDAQGVAPVTLETILASRRRRGRAKPAPGKAAPGKAAPGKAAPGKAAPGKAAPGKAAPGKAAPGKAAPGKAAPGKSAPGVSAPGNGGT